MKKLVKHPRAKRLAIGASIAAAAVLSVGLAGKFWIAPPVLRAYLSQAAADCWTGTVEIDEVDFNWFGPTHLRGVSLRDDSGRLWARARTVTLSLDNWPGMRPVLRAIEVERADVRAHFIDGLCRLPLKPFPADRAPSEYADLRRISLPDLSVELVDANGTTVQWPGLACEARRDGDRYRISVTRDAKGTPAPGEPLDLTCTLDPESLEMSIRLSGRQSVTPSQGGRLARILALPVQDFEGRIVADVQAGGSFREPESITFDGKVVLDGGRVAVPRGTLARNVVATIRLHERQIETDDLSAEIAGGDFRARALVTLPPNKAPRYEGDVVAQGMGLGDLDILLFGRAEPRAGRVDFRCRPFGAGTGDLQTADGVLRIDDADLQSWDLLGKLLGAAGIGTLAGPDTSDILLTFRSKGPTVTIYSARLANRRSAIVAEPGGTIDLKRERLDLHVVAAPISALRSALGNVSIPMIGQVLKGTSTAVETFSRVHVVGPWGDPEFTKEALDLGEGTLAVFKGIVDGGGQLGKGLFDSVGDMFRALNGGRKEPPRPPDAPHR